MSPPPVLTLRAQRELGAALRRIASDNPNAAACFYQAVPQAAHWIGGNPALGAHRLSLADLRYRFWSVPRYRYVMVYHGRH